jgi:two-component system sensor histidine kinase HydH
MGTVSWGEASLIGWLKKKPLLIPAAAFVAAVLILGLILTLLTARDLRRTWRLLEEEQFHKGMILIRTIEAGTRTGMMSRMFGREFTGRLLREASSEEDVEFIHIVLGNGQVVASSQEYPPGRFPHLPPGLDDGWARRKISSGREGTRMIIFKGFNPPNRKPMRRGHMMGREMETERPPEYIVLSLSMSEVEAAKREARKSAYFSGLLLLVAGVGGILLFGFVQNYYLLRKTLAATRSYADKVVESMADGLLGLDGDGVIVVNNQEALKILSEEARGLYGRRMEEVIPEMAQEAARSLRGGKTFRGKDLAISRGGRKIRLNYSITPLREEEDITGVVVLMRDVGEVEDLREQVKEGEKLAALGRMAAAVAHEVRNPLSSIKGFAQFLSGRFPEGSDDRRHTSVIIDEVNRLDRFVEELLIFVRPVQPQLRPAELESSIEGVLNLVREEAASRNIVINFSAGGNIPRVPLDPDQFKRAMLNIIINSMEALEEKGGEITVKVVEDDKGNVILTVTDSGPGIQEEDEEKVLESFFSTKPEGTGLGLSVVKQVADSHGWKFELGNGPDGGAVNIITIPGESLEKG